MTKNFQTKTAFRDAVFKYGAPLFYDGKMVTYRDDHRISLTIKGRAWHNGYSWCYYFREKHLYVKYGLSQDQLIGFLGIVDPNVFYTSLINDIKHGQEILAINIDKIYNAPDNSLGLSRLSIFLEQTLKNLNELNNSLIKP